MNKEQVTYWNYLSIEKLLSLQEGLEKNGDVEDADELHFIIIHQVYELWFKLLLSELENVRNKMNNDFVEEKVIPEVVHHIKRCIEIIKLASQQYKLMETLTPQDFMKFRAKLGTASGFQSFQMREVELIMGLNIKEREKFGNSDPLHYISSVANKSEKGEQVKLALDKRSKEPNIKNVVFNWLFRTPILGSSPGDPDDNKKVGNFITQYINSVRSSNESQIHSLIEDGGKEEEVRSKFEELLIQTNNFLKATDIIESKRVKTSRIRTGLLFIESYRDLPLLAWPRALIDAILELEEQFIGFRFNHARMVERVIGRRIGTGGSSGVDYLDRTTKYRVFRDLWAVRTIIVAKSILPELENSNHFGFVSRH